MNIRKWNKSTKGFIVAEVSTFAVAVGLNDYPLIAVPLMFFIIMGFGLWLVIKNPDKLRNKE